jgi:hypothetical protein
MKIFWENIERYPRFLITTILGLITLIIENIFKILSKRLRKKSNNILNRAIFICFLIIFLILAITCISMILNI